VRNDKFKEKKDMLPESKYSNTPGKINKRIAPSHNEKNSD
jgi:hypothetical protein